MTIDTVKAFVAARDKALADLDLEWVAKNYSMIPVEMRLLTLHKARYEAINVSADLRHASRAWLAERGYKRMTGTDLLPEGELPE